MKASQYSDSSDNQGTECPALFAFHDFLLELVPDAVIDKWN
jgi:hypothetical protein